MLTDEQKITEKYSCTLKFSGKPVKFNKFAVIRNIGMSGKDGHLFFCFWNEFQ